MKKWISGLLLALMAVCGGTAESLHASAAALTGWKYMSGHWYYYTAAGKATGWNFNGGKWYYLNSSGVMLTGWLNYGGQRYYLDSSGAMKTGWVSINGKWYYFDQSGAMKTGWILDAGKWYYLNASGIMQTGWLNYGGKQYYLYPSGAMAANTTIDGDKMGADGSAELINPNVISYDSRLISDLKTMQSVSSNYFYNPTTYKNPYPATAFHSSLAKNIYYYMLNGGNQTSVANTATLQHFGDPANTCAYFVSEELRRMGVPIIKGTMRVTQVDTQLASLGFKKDANLQDLKPGDICFTQGMTHVFTFMGWVNNGHYDFAYIVDNQANKFHNQVLHVRRLDIPTTEKDTDATAYFRYKI